MLGEGVVRGAVRAALSEHVDGFAGGVDADFPAAERLEDRQSTAAAASLHRAELRERLFENVRVVRRRLCAAEDERARRRLLLALLERELGQDVLELALAVERHASDAARLRRRDVACARPSHDEVVRERGFAGDVEALGRVRRPEPAAPGGAVVVEAERGADVAAVEPTHVRELRLVGAGLLRERKRTSPRAREARRVHPPRRRLRLVPNHHALREGPRRTCTVRPICARNLDAALLEHLAARRLLERLAELAETREKAEAALRPALVAPE
mmetsp:Transcript_2851/g.10375  ORF Transcript_2851/g.10375 Transcript_2851/m.10375 type:complete len:272 (+) Transcript_2851:1991-2806(+)